MPGVYIHIPFCVQKCKYCDFASYPSEFSRRYDYVEALIKEMKQYQGICADTVYIGGGTPTCLDNDCLELLLKNVNSLFRLENCEEFTVEANPGTVDADKAQLLKEYNVNRVSIGVQSFDDKLLKILGRIHNSEDIYKTYTLLRKCGFDNLSLDLMYALPGQSIEDLSTSIDKVLNLNPEHVSCYGLKYEDGTPFGEYLKKGLLKETDEDIFADMYELICKELNHNGYIHYEISNFAKKGMESRHNLKYWKCEDYLGFGAAAASCIGLRRFTHSPLIDDYFNGFALSEDYTMTIDEAMREFVILGLRVINGGVNKAEFKKRFSFELDDVFKNQIMRFNEFLINNENALMFSEKAALVSNSILCEFMN